MESVQTELPTRSAETLLFLYKTGDFSLLRKDIAIALRECYRFDEGKPGLLLRMFLCADFQFIGLHYKCEALQNVAVEILVCLHNHHLVALLKQAQILMIDLLP